MIAIRTYTHTGVYPDILKLAKVIPLHKGSSKQNLGNYRPISILSPFNKIFELLLHKKLLNFWNKHDLSSKYQFGFREHFSTGLAITQVFESLLNNKGINESSCAIFLDLAKAFDSINHQTLLDKLEHYGVRGDVHSLFKSYLENRKQCVSYKDVSSTFLPITTGVPQGSVLGPFLFLVYINDLPLCSKINTTLYADDTVLICSDKNINSLNLKTNEEPEKINLWFLSNKLSLNLSKTKYMLILNKPMLNTGSFSVKIGNTAIAAANSIKYLGVLFDDKLNWDKHIQHVIL